MENYNIVMHFGNESVHNDSMETTPSPPINQPRPTLQDILNQHWEYRFAQAFGLYVFPIVIFLGTIGNILTFIVLCRHSMRTTSTCIYMQAIAVLDLAVLYINAFRRWLTILNEGTDISTRSQAACITIHFFSYFTYHYSVWLVVAMTVERFIAIHFPLKAAQMATISRARKVTILLFIIFVAINSHIFWTVTIDDREFCIPEKEYEDFHDNVMPWLDAAIYSFAPFVVLLTFNILIIYDNRKATLRRRSMRSQNQRNNRTDSRQQFHQRLTAMLLSVSFTFLVCTSPKVIFMSIRESAFQFIVDGKVNYHGYASYLMASRISDFFVYLNHSINFFLYSIHGQRFRRELKKVLCCARGGLRRLSTISQSLDGVVNSRVTTDTFTLSSYRTRNSSGIVNHNPAYNITDNDE
ncbi:growth hormone secretagogue receptor type 1-like [Saccostrea echinata]|uniref:growth hormone secretagogue receptor type 1-like n=1 Tax=Saccostrea echinata TaxID=191078 RepID=UPI002A8098C1|nr:growth hormone secretagogue receptor type 1-like [Saccostrea echinata]